MSKKASKTLIGGFVLGAIVLLVAAVLILGSGKFFEKTYTVVMFFEGSVKGLNVGAPIMFKGVKLGSVKDIRLVLDTTKSALVIPVLAELEPKRITQVGPAPGGTPEERLQGFIKQGLRAQLQMQSVVTGQLMIGLEFFPDKPARYVGADKEYLEIPTIPTPLDELTQTIADLPIKDIVNKLDSVIGGLDRIVNSKEAEKAKKDVAAALESAREILDEMEKKLGPFMASVHETSEAARASLREAEETMAAVKSALKESEKVLANFRDDSRLMYEVRRSVKDLSGAARSMKDLSDYLERHPESLLTGKGNKKGE